MVGQAPVQRGLPSVISLNEDLTLGSRPPCQGPTKSCRHPLLLALGLCRIPSPGMSWFGSGAGNTPQVKE